MGKNDLVSDPRNKKRLIFAWQRDRLDILGSGGPTPEQALSWSREDADREREQKIDLFAAYGRRPGNPRHPIVAERLMRESEAKARAEEAREDRIAEKIAKRLGRR